MTSGNPTWETGDPGRFMVRSPVPSTVAKSTIEPVFLRLPSLPRLLGLALVPVFGIVALALVEVALVSPWGDALTSEVRTSAIRAGMIGILVFTAVLGLSLFWVIRLSRSLAQAVVGAADAASAMAAGDFAPARDLPQTSVREGALLRRAVRHGARRIEELTTGLEEQVVLRTAQLEVAKEQAQAARALAEEASKAKSLFLANMGHELRTPLNAIIGYAEMVSEELAGKDPASEQDLGRIVTAAHHLLALINDILDYTKSEAGRMQVRREPYELRAVFDQAVASVQPLVAQHGNHLIVELDPKLSAAHGDALKLRQVLINLLGNAAKFTEEGEIRLRAFLVEDDHVRIEVSDSGIGMDGRQQANLFTPFQTSSSQQRHGGSGLGLAICHHYCRLMGGEITCRSEPGVGSVFTVRIPRELDDADDSSSRVRTGMILAASWSRPSERTSPRP